MPVIALQQPIHSQLSVSTSIDNNASTSVVSKPACSPSSVAETPKPLKTTEGDRPSMVGVVEQLELLARRQPPRIAVKAKGKIFFMGVAEIVAVHSQGNYASLTCRSSSYLLRESLGSIALKLKPYGFIQIHRSVLVNASLVDEVWPSSTGEYRLRIQNGVEYVVTRRYRDNLRHLAYVWLGAEGVFSSARAE